MTIFKRKSTQCKTRSGRKKRKTIRDLTQDKSTEHLWHTSLDGYIDMNPSGVKKWGLGGGWSEGKAPLASNFSPQMEENVRRIV
jgi:hypothetical protein